MPNVLNQRTAARHLSALLPLEQSQVQVQIWEAKPQCQWRSGTWSLNSFQRKNTISACVKVSACVAAEKVIWQRTAQKAAGTDCECAISSIL